MPPAGDRRLNTRVERVRTTAARTVDVSRLEFENLYTEIDALMKGLRRIDADIRRLGDRLSRLERDSARHS